MKSTKCNNSKINKSNNVHNSNSQNFLQAPCTCVLCNTNLHITPERFKEVCIRPSVFTLSSNEFSSNSSTTLNSNTFIDSNTKDIISVLEYFFDPNKNLNTPKNNVDILKSYFIGATNNYDTFKEKLKLYDNSLVCGLVWNINYVAYRCRTCALSPCMSICAECFKNGDHEGHDFNMFRSGAGGACDCGDECVMNPKGFCKAHGCCTLTNTKSSSLNSSSGNNNASSTNRNHYPPEDLTKCCEIIFAHLLYRLLQSFRLCFSMSDCNFNSSLTTHRINLQDTLKDIQPYLDLLNELCALGTPIRKILADYMINEAFYNTKVKSEQEQTGSFKYFFENFNINTKSTQLEEYQEDPLNFEDLTIEHKIYLKALSMQPIIKAPAIFNAQSNELFKLEHKNMIDELLFWCIRFEFPEHLVKFLLSLLPDLRYKNLFIKSFVAQYSYISLLLLNSKSEHLSSRVVHISVQLFSNEAMAIKALDECHLLPIILSTLYNMIVNTNDSTSPNGKLLMKSKIELSALIDTSFHLVVDPDHAILQENLYWLVISDLVNLLSHKQVALAFLSDKNLFNLWLELVGYFQTMNLNVRQFGEHLQQEQPTYFSSFSAELEFCSSIMWSFIQHLNSENNQIYLTNQLLSLILKKLDMWLVSIGFTNTDTIYNRPNFKHLSFHLPLHRYLSVFLYNALYVQMASTIDIELFSSKYSAKSALLANLLAHPLQLQIGFHEVHANMWVRNGMQMRGQAMTFVQNHFCSSFSDADLFLVQCLATKLDPNLFMNIFLERFHLTNLLKESIKKRIKIKKIDENDAIANVVEYMLDEFESTSSSTSRTTTFSTNEIKNLQDYLEPSHQTSMLIGALTVLAQIILIKPNLKLKSYCLTRTEIVNLLCVSDRTFSQIEENLPDICSLTSAKKYIQPILDNCADFLQPTLDALSIGSLKQGRYKPKDKIWLYEYDPLYVMLRSVKRREFQESFDRYAQFVSKHFTNLNKTKKKNLWPPFRMPSSDRININTEMQTNKELCKEIDNDLRIDKELIAKWNILNTKQLHALIINILYENYYGIIDDSTNGADQSPVITEKILYFIVYVLELAVYMSLNFNLKDSKLSPLNNDCNVNNTSKIPFDELNYETWFKTNDIADNLCTYVSFTKYELNKEFNPTKNNTTELENEANKNADDFLDNKHRSQQPLPPYKKMCSGININGTSWINQSSTGNEENVNQKDQYIKTYNYESILSLLVKMFYKNKANSIKKADSLNETTFVSDSKIDFQFLKSATYHEENDEFSFEKTRIGDENDFIHNLLEQAAKLNEKCRLNIENTIETLNHPTNNQILTPLDEFEGTTLGDSQSKINSEASDTQFNKSINIERSISCSSTGDSNLDVDLLKNKKSKAKARQQKLLAQMSSNQKAFLSNPINKIDIEAYSESTSTLKSKKSDDKNDTSLSSLETQENGNEFSNLEKIKQSEEKVEFEEAEMTEEEEIYDCCICRLSTKATPERPIGVVTLLQSTSVLAHRESDKCKKEARKLPLSDDFDYKNLVSDTTCWKQEEKRIKNLLEAFSLSSCKYSINIGWKGGIFAQMCGHYLHFDCFNSYKQTLDQSSTSYATNHLANPFSRNNNIEYDCPLCRQVSNCVLPVLVSTTSAGAKNDQKASSSSSSLISNDSFIYSTVSNTPAKLWILSSLVDKQKQIEALASQPNETNLQLQFTSPNEKILHLLKTRPFSNPSTNSKVLTQCKNDALTLITLTTPIEFRYLDNNNSSMYGETLNPASTPATAGHLVDDDIALFTTSVLRSQLEIDLMLKEQHNENSLLSTVNFKKKRSCFLPLMDVVGTHCKLMCHEFKPHVKQWLMLIDQKISNDIKQITGTNNMTVQEKSIVEQDEKQVPLLLRDPIATLLLIIVNLPQKIEKRVFNLIIKNVFNMVFIQSIIGLCREFDEEEREIWATSISKNDAQKEKWLTFKDYVSNVINTLQNPSKNIFEQYSHKTSNSESSSKSELNSASFYKIKTIWTNESAKNFVEQKCLHFMKIASLLQSYLYNQEVLTNEIDSFDYLAKYLNIHELSKREVNDETITYWLRDLSKAYEHHPEQVNNLLNLSFASYNQPELLQLPYLYSDLFSYYLNKKCQFCSKIPKETGICLLCGAQVCYKTNYCCDQMRDFNKKHVNACGAGTFVLININSTYVFVIRGKRCAPWASLYLDEHGEEDRDLRRGKPLYLNEQRFNLLKKTWYSHTFDYQSLKWYNSSLFIY